MKQATIDILQVDGDSMNDTYQDTEGRLRFIFSVEHMNSAPVEQAANIVKKIPVINKIPGVNTGDPTTIGLISRFFCRKCYRIDITYYYKSTQSKE